MRIILGFILLLITSLGYCADNYTANYNLVIPEEGSKDWTAKISADIVSLDTILNNISQDASFTKSGTNVILKTITNNVGVGTTAPLVKLEAIGQISADAYRFDTQTASPDTATLIGPCIVASRDIAGVVRLNFYDGTVWRRVSLE